VAVCAWSRPPDSDLFAVYGALRAFVPAAGGETPPVHELLRDAGLEPGASGEVDVPWLVPDRPALERALLAPGSAAPAIERAGEAAVRATLLEAAAPFRRSDGSYRFQNRFSYVIATSTSAGGAQRLTVSGTV
jgi:hypothetical protein